MSNLAEKPIEYKWFAGGQFKAIDDSQGIIEGILNAIGNIDDGNDRTMPGAFKRTINAAYDRKKADPTLDYLWPYLWNHDYDVIPPGGIFDADEVKAQGTRPAGLFIKAQLNLEYQLARDVYSGFKFGTLRKQSMGYKAAQYEYVKEDKSILVRNLLEIAMAEGSAVVFPMNQLADVTNVKSGLWTPQRYWHSSTNTETHMETKSICGNTSGTIGPRDEAWSGSKAEKQIWAAAEKDDGSLNVTLCKKYFMVCDGDGSKKGSYSYPFWYVGDSPHICVGAVKAIAGAISGARGASAPDGLKSKVATLYNRINSKYPDDAQLTPPWEDDSGKRSNPLMEKKDFNDLYQDAQAADALEDWGDLVNSLTGAMIQLFTIGDEPAADMQTALDQFSAAVLVWVDEAEQAGLSDMLCDSYGSNSSTPYIPYSMRIGSMSNRKPLARKAGAQYSAENLTMLGAHIGALHGMGDTIHAMADDLAENTGATSYVDPDAKPDPAKETDKNKANSRQTGALRKHSSPNGDTANNVNDGNQDVDMEAAFAALAQLSTTLL